jgi:phosphoribosylaminoimidazole-succinocarboxamide synthase
MKFEFPHPLAHFPAGAHPLYIYNCPWPTSGKVRDTYRIPHPDHTGQFCLLVVATDRVSSHDFVLYGSVPNKGAVLTALNIFWATQVLTDFKHDLLAFGKEVRKFIPAGWDPTSDFLERTIVVKELDMLPIECVARQHITGGGLKTYNRTAPHHILCGHKLPAGLKDGSRLPETLFTPTTKAHVGHDEDRNAARVMEQFGRQPENITLAAYKIARQYAEGKNVIIADSKLELGYDLQEKVLDPDCRTLVIGDERFTPDSSRFWHKDEWEQAMAEGRTPPSHDKQIVREYCEQLGISKRDPKNEDDVRWVHEQFIPGLVTGQTSKAYLEIFNMITGQSLSSFQKDVMGI